MIDKRNILAKLNNAFCNIYELQSVENEFGVTNQAWVLVYENIACKLSKKTLNDINQSSNEALAVNSMVLFLDDRIAVKKGSRVECRGYVFYAGEPFLYPDSHQEIPMYVKEFA